MGFFNSIWKGIKTGFGALTGNESVYYPGNPDREERVKELYNQNANLFHETNQLIKKIQNKIAFTSDYVDDELELILEMSISNNWKNKDLEDLKHEISLNNFYEIFVLQAFAIQDKTRSHTFDVIDLPLDLKMFSIAGIPIYVPVGGVIGGSISGAIKRSKLENAIKDHEEVRTELIRCVLILRIYLKELEEIIPNFDQLEKAGVDRNLALKEVTNEIKSILKTPISISITDIRDMELVV